MRIPYPDLLKLFRTEGECEVCERPCLVREPHHIRARGVGDVHRLDIRINLIALGSSRPGLGCDCHERVHTWPGVSVDAKTRLLLEKVAEREGDVIWHEIPELIWRIEALPQTTTEDELEELGLLGYCIYNRYRMLPNGDIELPPSF